MCLALASALFLLAVDVGRWSDAMAADDVRYRAEPEGGGLWQAGTTMPFDLGEARSSATGDDVAFRQAVKALRLGRLDLGITSDPELALTAARLAHGSSRWPARTPTASGGPGQRTSSA